MQHRTQVGVLGATGTVGERLVRMLVDHPWFELVEVGASGRSAGLPLGTRVPASEAGALPPSVASLRLKKLDEPWRAPLLLSALPSSVAAEIEPALARAGHLVVSNASAHRTDPDVPLVIPEVNPDHLQLVGGQSRRWPGAIVTNPNCVVAGVALALAPLHRVFGIDRVIVTTFQAISGAGRPGPAAAQMTDNVVPFIPGEEEKIGRECRRILGTVVEGASRDATFPMTATATRVPVLHGHLASLSVGLTRSADVGDVASALRDFEGDPSARDLPLAPAHALEVTAEDDRPQPRVDRDRGDGMTVSVGRIRPCAVLDVTFLVLAHNLVRGAAGAALLNAELCHARGLTKAFGPGRVATTAAGD